MARKILIVDDDNATRIGLVALLGQAGYDVVAVSTLQTGTKALVEEAPDLVITDLRLGDFNGLHLVATNPTRIPVIVITGFPDRALEAEAHRLGAEFLLKPVAPADLLLVIERKLAGETSAQDASFRPARRWPRKRPTTELPAEAENAGAVRVVDMSYGGLSLAVHRAPGAWLPRSLRVTFPTASVSVRMQVVWQRSSDASWFCGGVVAEEEQLHWRQLVDAVT